MSNFSMIVKIIQKLFYRNCKNWFRNLKAKFTIQRVSNHDQLILNRIQMSCFNMTKYVLSDDFEIFFNFNNCQNVTHDLKFNQRNRNSFFESMNQNWFSLNDRSFFKINFFHFRKLRNVPNDSIFTKALKNDQS